MIQHKALAMAIGLTTFVMTIVAVMLYQLSAPGASTVSAVQSTQPVNAPVIQPAAAVENPAPAVSVTADQAASIALKSVPNGRLLNGPELVNFQGALAYEVTLASGLVYVDANTGRVLHNGALPAQGVAQQGSEREHDSKHDSKNGSNGEHYED